MDPAHLQLGDEGYKNLQRERVWQLGVTLLQEIRAERPELQAYGVEKTSGFMAHPEGWLTEFIFHVRSRRLGLLSRLFPRILAVVRSDHGLLPYSRVEVKQPGIWEVASRIGGQARKLDFSVEKPKKLF